jgi:hypothetical protein
MEMKKVYKYGLPQHGPATLVMPAGAELLHVGHQWDHVHLWAMVDERVAETEPRRIYVAQTGEDLPEDRKRYLGTVLMMHGEYVVHVFELAL